MNFVGISGNLVRDVELRYTPGGSAVGNMTIANNQKWTDPKTNELKEKVAFIGVVIWGKQAETVAQYFKKGSPILVQGRLEQEVWTDKQTQKEVRKTIVVMEKFDFMSSNSGGARESSSAPAPAARPTARPPMDRPPVKAEPPPEDDVPF